MAWVKFKDVANLISDIVRHVREKEEDPFALTPAEIQYGERVAEILSAKTILKARSDEVLVDVAKRQMEHNDWLTKEVERLRKELASAVKKKKRKKT